MRKALGSCLGAVLLLSLLMLQPAWAAGELTFTTSPAPSVNQNSYYGYFPVVTGSAAGATKTFSINKDLETELPWAKFDTAKGWLESRDVTDGGKAYPRNEHVGVYSGIEITVTDSDGKTGTTGIFTITVVNVNDAPVLTATPASPTTAPQSSLFTFSVTAEDPDTLFNPERVEPYEKLTYSLENNPAWISIHADTGEMTGTPANSDVGLVHNVTVKVVDKAGLSDTEVFTLEVSNVNDAPTITGTPGPSVNQGGGYSFVPTAHDVDLDLKDRGVPVPDVLTFSVEALPDWAEFNTATGELKNKAGRPTNDDVRIYTDIKIIVADRAQIEGREPLDPALTATLGPFSIEVKNVNDNPFFPKEGGQNTPPTSVEQDATYRYEFKADDIDLMIAGASDVLTYSIGNKPSWATFTTETQVTREANTRIGVLTGTPGNSYIGKYLNVIITVSDGQGGSAQLDTDPVTSGIQGFDITVTDKNDGPTISVDGEWPKTVKEGKEYLLKIKADDPDLHVDPAFVTPPENLVFTATPDPLPAWLTLTQTGNTATLSGTPGNLDVGTVPDIVITVTDRGSLTASLDTFTITVENVNNKPEISGTPATEVTQGNEYSFIVSATDQDLRVNGPDQLTFSVLPTPLPAWLKFEQPYIPIGRGAMSDAQARLYGTPANEDVGEVKDITISVSDGQGGSATLAAFTIKVINANDGPKLVQVPTPVVDVKQGDPINFYPIIPGKRVAGTDMTNIVKAEDLDIIYEDQLHYELTQKPAWLSIIDVNNTDGMMIGIPGNDDVTPTPNDFVNAQITVKDKALVADVYSFKINVMNVNDLPAFNTVPPKTGTSVVEGNEYLFAVTADDIDIKYGDRISYSLNVAPVAGAFTPEAGWLSIYPDPLDVKKATLRGTPKNVNVGSFNVTITATDSYDGKVEHTFAITVVNVNSAPKITSPVDITKPPVPLYKGKQDEEFNLTVEVTDDDILHGDIVTFTLTGAPAWLSVKPVAVRADQQKVYGLISGTPTKTDIKITNNITLTVKDSKQTPANPAGVFNLEVVNVNDPPTISGVPPVGIVGEAYSFVPTAEDPDGDTLRFTIEGTQPPWAIINTNNGEISNARELVKTDVGTYSNISIRVSDGNNAEAVLGPFSILVIESVIPGDVDGNGKVELKDALLAVEIMAGIPQNISINILADVDGDGLIGQAEVIYILNQVMTPDI
jgi:hypothetical protein